MAIGKCVARAAFEVTLEMLYLFKSFKRNINSQFPRCQLRGVIASAGVMIGHPLFQVGRVADVIFPGWFKLSMM
jgi:hypothetical protein